jgi:uncharacterized protein YigE (DUF2233 family)
MILLLGLLSVTGIQCSEIRYQDNPVVTPVQEQSNKWKNISRGIDRIELVDEYEGKTVKLLVYKLDQTQITSSLEHTDQPKRLEEWETNTKSEILLNAGYFDENFRPTGLFVINGDEIGGNRYDPSRSGLIKITDGYLIIEDTDFIPDIQDNISLLQSFPLLLSNGKPAVKEDSEKLARRTVIAQDSEEHIYLIVIDQTPISLYGMMQVLIDSELPLDMALNLDGGTSTGIRVRSENYSESITPLTPLPQILRFSAKN